MTARALDDELSRRGATPPSGPPPVKPPWLRPATTVAVVAAHIGVFALLAYSAIPQVMSLDSIDMELVQEGDYFEAEEQSEAEDKPPPETMDEPELALPPPMVMSPDAPPLPMKKEEKEKVVRKPKEERKEIERAEQRREAQQRRRYGAQEGRGQNAGASQATCLAHIASSLRSHTPGSTSLGAGNAHVTFHVHAGGGLSIVSVSGSSPGHAAMARRIVASSRGPGSCGSAFLSQSFRFR